MEGSQILKCDERLSCNQRRERWASPGTTGTGASRPGAREVLTTRSRSMGWDVWLPVLRLAYTQSTFGEAGSAMP